ncbi:D-amino-acid dehydrogenase [Geomicrobium halophilum]|uniref:D-amino-acid dehydrogenase n=1 Tax=Geomicrobium halophilum TaxID=549000 RepID=A0A841Q0I0_9BACL|nr:FAD-dependent oxidoreductase [Geomicrobium halophilum]MBB6451203.1 D-amino-acid dehydrogenase [Geomicrobium halophilum]
MNVSVVGGGIVGMSTAYHLAREGTDVTLIDQGHKGQATAAGAGIVCPWISSKKENQAWYTLARGGAHYYQQLIDMLSEDGEDDWGFKRVGSLAVSDQEAELDAIEAGARASRQESPEVGEIARLSNKEARKVFPPLGEHLGAVHLSGAARIDGGQLRDALRRGAEKHGATIIQGKAELHAKGREVQGVYVEEKLHYADHVIMATGAWASEPLASIGVSLPIEPQRGQILHLHIPGAATSEWPIVLPTTSHYMLAFDDSRVVVGASRENGTGFDYRQTAGGIQEVLESGLSIAPKLADSTLSETRIGFRPVTPDEIPIIGRIHHLGNISVANGLGPSGLTMGPYVGKVLSDHTLGKEMELDLSPYDPLRFET